MSRESTIGGDKEKQALRTYLRDHSAGAEYALQLFNALKDEHLGTALGDFAATQADR